MGPIDARKFFTDKSVNKNTLQRFREQLLNQTFTASCLEIVKDEEMENISYLYRYVVIGKRRDVIRYSNQICCWQTFSS